MKKIKHIAVFICIIIFISTSSYSIETDKFTEYCGSSNSQDVTFCKGYIVGVISSIRYKDYLKNTNICLHEDTDIDDIRKKYLRYRNNMGDMRFNPSVVDFNNFLFIHYSCK
jgi:hypothetical protein